MVIYSFSIHNADGEDHETVGRMALAHDKAARAFGKLVIRDMMRGDGTRYAGWTMDVTKGARPVFSIFFPRTESFPTQLDSIGKDFGMATSAARRPVVLVVEDEFLLRMNAAEMIAGAGFEVVEAANADEAIAVLEARLDIHVVFTDIQMPGSMNGLKLASFVRGRWPPIKIVATSGFVRVGEADLPEGSRFLTKPYRPAQIIETLRELTGGA